MPDIRERARSMATLFSIEKAALDVVGCTPQDILHYGALEKIQLCIEIPGHVAVWRRESLDLWQEQRPRIGHHEPMGRAVLLPKVKLLDLSEEDCAGILSGIDYSQSVFESGWELDEYFAPCAIGDPEGRIGSTEFFREGILGDRLVTYSHKQGAMQRLPPVSPPVSSLPLRIRIQDVRITADELKTFKALFESLRDDELAEAAFRVHPHRSEDLNRLDDVAQAIWEEAAKAGGKYPSREALIGRLKRAKAGGGCGFTRTVATAAAKLIEPEYSTSPSNPAAGRQRTPHRTPKFMAAIAAWQELWRDVNLRNRSEIPHSDDLAQELARRLELDEGDARGIAKLIRPDAAKRIRAVKKPKPA